MKKKLNNKKTNNMKYLKLCLSIAFTLLTLMLGNYITYANEHITTGNISSYIEFHDNKYILSKEAYNIFSEEKINNVTNDINEINTSIENGYYLVNNTTGTAVSTSLLTRAAGKTGTALIYNKDFGLVNRYYIKASDLNLLWNLGLFFGGVRVKTFVAQAALAYLGYKTNIQHGIYIDFPVGSNFPIGFGQQ